MENIQKVDIKISENCLFLLFFSLDSFDMKTLDLNIFQ